MSDGGDDPFKELKIFPEGVFCPLPKQDSGETDSKLLIGRTVDDALNYFNNKLKSLRGRISDAEYAVLEKELFEFQRRLGSLTSSNAGVTGNNQPEISLFKATTTHTHNGRTVNVGILEVVGDRVNFLDAHRLVDDFNRQHNTNVKLITPHLADAMLTDGTDAWRFFHDNKCYPLLTNALVAYEAPSKQGSPVHFGRNLARP